MEVYAEGGGSGSGGDGDVWKKGLEIVEEKLNQF